MTVRGRGIDSSVLTDEIVAMGVFGLGNGIEIETLCPWIDNDADNG